MTTFIVADVKFIVEAKFRLNLSLCLEKLECVVEQFEDVPFSGMIDTNAQMSIIVTTTVQVKTDPETPIPIVVVWKVGGFYYARDGRARPGTFEKSRVLQNQQHE